MKSRFIEELVFTKLKERNPEIYEHLTDIIGEMIAEGEDTDL